MADQNGDLKLTNKTAESSTDPSPKTPKREIYNKKQLYAIRDQMSKNPTSPKSPSINIREIAKAIAK